MSAENEKKRKSYVSVDVETSGPTPGKYSMLSLGACLVSDPRIGFYKEIQPISPRYIPAAVRVSTPGFAAVKKRMGDPRFDAANPAFDAHAVLEALVADGEKPREAMDAFAQWVAEHTCGRIPVLAAAPIKFDGMFVSYYFDNFASVSDPFTHTGEDIASLYRGVTGSIYGRLDELGLRPDQKLTHNALEDARQQAYEMQAVLNLMHRTKR